MQGSEEKTRGKRKNSRSNDPKEITITFLGFEYALSQILSRVMAIAPATILRPTLMIIVTLPVIYSMTEAEALVSLKSTFTNAQLLNGWVAGSAPCSLDDQWEGVVCNNGLVTGLRLGGIGLVGEIHVDPLLELKGLRTISLNNNSFTGSMPEFNRIGFLKALYLQGNKFSGDIPQEYFQRMRSLKKVWLSDNQFTGNIPHSLTEISSLMELHLENNQFSGTIPDFKNPTLEDINLSNNKLEGEVPASLLRFSENRFSGNSALCGEKIGKTCEKPAEVPSPAPIDASDAAGDSPVPHSSTPWEVAAIIVVSVVLVSIVVFFIVRTRKKKEEERFDILGNDANGGGSVEVQVATTVKRDVDANTLPAVKKSSSRRGSAASQSKGVGELVIVNDEKGVFGLPDLMRAAAEVLGNGSFGSSYKAVMANGVAVVVKRTREMNVLEKDGFDAEMRKLTSLKHWNILTPLAYHFRKDEKLVISEYVPKGSLLFSLHGDRGSSHTELDWPARMKVVGGIAEGMNYLHKELGSSDLPHGNLKSSNVLLGPDNEPLLVDYGFSGMVNPSSAAQTLFAYKAPEAAENGEISHSCDVYCLGVVILEILTGKFPSQYLSTGKGGTDVVQWVETAISEGRVAEVVDPEIANSRKSVGEMEQLLHIGAACTRSNPLQRLGMEEAFRRIDQVRSESGLVKGSRTTEVLPSLVDDYEDAQEFESQGHFDNSHRRHGTDSFGSVDNIELGSS
ncbi:pollen receptor-like kinase 3 [Vigna umbellata]|uniref:pollen receptor-like kinase 3 n=1 Tax=Vigna umbellata TaxID=87088 RepID=UPI001F5EB46B|nr:pollen receptor-like kinase 3 [Vigna umbellata]XP_047167836.1 pollen receptor-like kinase 3 [Vigna umbellata]